MRTLLVAGSRSFQTWGQGRMNVLLDNASYTFDRNFDQIMEGEAPGVDRMARKWAEHKGYPVKPMPALWDMYGKSAGHRRNVEMAEELDPERGDAAILVWDGVSRGTKDMLDLVQASGVDFVLVHRKP